MRVQVWGIIYDADTEKTTELPQSLIVDDVEDVDDMDSIDFAVFRETGFHTKFFYYRELN